MLPVTSLAVYESSCYVFHAITIRAHVSDSSLYRSKHVQSPCPESAPRKWIDLDSYMWTTASIENARLGGSKTSLSILTPTRAKTFVSTDSTNFRVPLLLDQKRPRPLTVSRTRRPSRPPVPSLLFRAFLVVAVWQATLLSHSVDQL